MCARSTASRRPSTRCYYTASFLSAQLAAHGFEIAEVRRQDYPEADGSVTVDLFLFARRT
jgi:hypothetical protein